MKNRLALLLFVVVSLTYACGNTGEEQSKEAKEPIEETGKMEEAQKELALSPANTVISFTAYKTTDKAPVKGVFKTVNFEKRKASDVEELLNGLEFSIPVSSLFTNDATKTRDPKIMEFFFGAMLNTEMLSGTITSENGAYSAKVLMNGVENSMPLSVEISADNVLVATGTVNIAEWDALEALASLNKACFDLHKGLDGVSKTWEDVTVEITAKLQ